MRDDAPPSERPTDASSGERGAEAPPSESGLETTSSGSSSPLLDVRDVSLSYGDTEVLDTVSAAVAESELVGLVGPNGAGKTTLLHAVSGALEPDSGTVLVDGDDVQALSSAAASRRIAVVPQETTLSFGFTVRQLVEMGRHPHRSRFQRPSPRDHAIVDRAMGRTRTAQFADRSIDEVSGGERQRVLLARALAQDAPLLLLDEPTANLDLHHAVETMALVRELVDDGQTAIAAIHDLELAARFCDRLLLLAGGEVVATGPPAEVLDAERVEAAFGARAAVEPEPIGGGVAVRTFADGEEREKRDDPSRSQHRVHVVGGGQPAASALGALGEAGVTISIGPLPSGDRAVATARALDADVVEAPRFQAVDRATLHRARSLAGSADAVVLAVDDVETVQGCPAAWIEICEAAPVVRCSAARPDGPVDSVERSESPAGVDIARCVSREELPEAVAAVAADTDGRSLDRRRSSQAAPRADGGEETGAGADEEEADDGEE